MATTAQGAKLNPLLYNSDQFVPVSASGIASIITQGDWVAYSAQWGMPAHDAFIGSPAYKVSAAGVAIDQNPTYDHLGRAVNNSGLTVMRRGVLRVSAAHSGTAYTIPKGAHAYPDTTGSGIVGTTGATGVAAIWATAPPQGISANPTGAIASGVAVVINHPVGGDVGLGQIDIVFNLGTNVSYF